MSRRAYHVIYVLLDPDTDDVRYIGQTRQMESRKQNYMGGSAANLSTPLGRWLIELASVGKFPKFEVLAKITGSHQQYVARAGESALIKAYALRGDGHLLLNLQGNPRRPKQRSWSRRPKNGKPPGMEKGKYGKFIEFDGQKKNLRGWAELIGITPQALSHRLKKYPPEVALRPKASA